MSVECSHGKIHHTNNELWCNWCCQYICSSHPKDWMEMFVKLYNRVQELEDKLDILKKDIYHPRD